jgi:hypothetical protein
VTEGTGIDPRSGKFFFFFLKIPRYTFAGRKYVRNGEQKSRTVWLDRRGRRREEKVKFCLCFTPDAILCTVPCINLDDIIPLC